MNHSEHPIFVGISSCLLGEKVRFDGNHKHQPFITDELGNIFSFVPICPEMAIGLGVPRRPIRLVGGTTRLRAVGVHDSDLDVTDKLVDYGKQVASTSKHLSGYIFKKGSPSCGMERVKIYGDNRFVSNDGIGLFANEIMRANTLLPAEEEGRLQNPSLKENFIQRVIVYYRWQQLMLRSLTVKALIEFHTRQKFLLLAHDERAYREIGRLLARVASRNLAEIADSYIHLLMNGLKKPSTRKRHTNVLQHIMGFLKKHIDSDDKQELQSLIQGYLIGELPLEVPKSLLRHHFRRFSNPFIKDQFYLYEGALQPSPEFLGKK